MATLQKIRTRAGLLVAIVIGISLAAFILGDMFQSGSSIFQRDRLEVGEIDGESVQYPEFQKELVELGEIYKQNTQQTQLDENSWVQVREQAWQNLVRKIVMGDVYKDLGVNVSSDELFDMIQGANLHPIIQQLFRNQETGQVDRSAVVRFLKSLETGVAPEQREYWLYLEKQIMEERIQSKYSNMVGKGLYVTGEEAQRSVEAKSKKVNFDYIALNFNTVADSSVNVSEKDLNTYFNNHTEEYNQEASRTLEYVIFPVEPSEEDFAEAEKWINDIKSDFELATDNIQFVNSNSDISFTGEWNKKENLSEEVGSWIFDENAEVNQVYGPVFEIDRYTLTKVHAIEMMPDSVEARHILLQVNSQAEVAAMQNLADSLKTAIENGSDFAALAGQYSADQGSAIAGGELGWFSRGQMVKPFEEAAFNNKRNEVTVVASQFGIHIVQTMNRGVENKQVQVADLVRIVEPSTRTYQNIYALASKFAGENRTMEEFESAVAEQNLNKRVASVKENDRQMAGLENARPLIRAAYASEEGNVVISNDIQESPIFELGDNFVVALLTKVVEEGPASFEQVRDRVELNVVKEKKAELLVEKTNAALEGKNSLEEVAEELDATVQSASGVSFTSFSIPGVGVEPALVGSVTNMEVDKISGAISGNNGVYVVKVTSIDEEAPADIALEKENLSRNLAFRAGSQAYEAHRKDVEIIDKRSKFY